MKFKNRGATMAVKQSRYSLYLLPESHDQLKRLSNITGVSVNQLINFAVEEYLENRQDLISRGEEIIAQREALNKELGS